MTPTKRLRFTWYILYIIRAKRVSNWYIPKKKSARVHVCTCGIEQSSGDQEIYQNKIWNTFLHHTNKRRTGDQWRYYSSISRIMRCNDRRLRLNRLQPHRILRSTGKQLTGKQLRGLWRFIGYQLAAQHAKYFYHQRSCQDFIRCYQSLQLVRTILLYVQWPSYCNCYTAALL